MDKKRILLVIGFFILTLVLGFALFRIFFAAPTEEPTFFPSDRTPTEPGQFPSSGDAGDGTTVITPPDQIPTSVQRESGRVSQEFLFGPSETQLTSDLVSELKLDNNGNASFYNQQDGRFYTIDAEGNIVPLSEKVFFNVENATWAASKDRAILEYPDGSNLFYDFEAEKQVTLPKHWESFSFDPNGNEIAAKSIGISPENRWLITSDPSGQQVTLVEQLGENQDKVTVDWSPNTQVLGFSRTGAALGAEREQILLVGKNGENFKSLVVEGRGFESTWSPKGDKLIYSVYSSQSEFKPQLWITNAQGDSIGTDRRPLSINTWAEKCQFAADNRFLYCGVPQEMETGVGFAPELAEGTPDDLYKIDTQTGAKTRIPLSETHVVDTLTVSPDGNTLFLTDKVTNGIFKVEL
ncbi:MAG: hypothetical protein HOE53_01175 [Candidatus Magasanikbacteria bacterium]|jgi:hypothetical protein|nr:hypothetical protein [Candidatus Magasanikbacteria bacterium]